MNKVTSHATHDGVIDSLARHLQERVNKAEARVEKLEKAIRKHHRDTWSDGVIQHPNDVELYRVLRD